MNLSRITPPPLDCDIRTHRHGCGECDGCRWYVGYFTVVLYIAVCGLGACAVGLLAVAFDLGPGYYSSKTLGLTVFGLLALLLAPFALLGSRGTDFFAPPEQRRRRGR